MSAADNTDKAALLASAMDCITEEELVLLAKVEPGTVEAWRKRGQGPAYILFGNRYLYPRKVVSAYLHSLVRERHAVPKGSL